MKIDDGIRSVLSTALKKQVANYSINYRSFPKIRVKLHNAVVEILVEHLQNNKKNNKKCSNLKASEHTAALFRCVSDLHKWYM